MKVLGTVKDAATEVPLPGAKIRLYVREEELAVLQSDSEGTFRHESESQYIGEILICKVEKAGYEPQKVIQEFEEDEVTLAIKLVPGKDEKIVLTFNLKDKKRNPLKGVNISLELDGEGVGVGISDKDGVFKIALSPDFEGKTINYKAELAGFELASGAVLLKKETSVKITMKKPVPPPKWLIIAAVVAGIAIVILAVMIILPTPELEMPEIKYFVASPSMLGPGDSSKLSWEVSDATHVNIEPAIGDVALTGSRVISPVETTTYTLTATNDAGKRFDKVEVIVKEGEVNLPVISSFEASPSAISAGEGSKLSWIVSDATRVTIEPAIGDVALTGTRQASPTETTIYTLTATNDAGNRFDTVKVIVKDEEVNLPVISSFEASPSAISAEEGSKLSWSVSDATRVTIDHEIGRVDLTGTRQASPTETTIYTLTAINDAGNRFDTVKVIVKEEEINLPVIKYFEASPSEIKPDESSTLSWDVSDTASVTIGPGIGNVGLTDTKVVSPTKTTTYTLTATNDAGSVDDTVEVLVSTTPLLPELYVNQFSLDPSTPIQGRPVSVSVGVYNKGDVESGAFTVLWWAGEKFIAPACTWQVDSLAAGSGRSLTCTYDGYTSWHDSLTTKAVVDSAKVVAESNEENNEERKTIRVGPRFVTLRPTQPVLKSIPVYTLRPSEKENG